MNHIDFAGSARDSTGRVGLEGVDAQDQGRQPHRQILANYFPRELYAVQCRLLDLLRAVRCSCWRSEVTIKWRLLARHLHRERNFNIASSNIPQF
jgi:hypothetical protein